MLLDDEPIKPPHRELFFYEDDDGNKIVSDSVDRWVLYSGEWFLVEDNYATTKATKH